MLRDHFRIHHIKIINLPNLLFMMLHNMNNHLFPSLVLRLVFSIFCILLAVPAYYCDDDEQYLACRDSYLFECGPNKLNISYPFWGNNRTQDCGREEFQLKCEDNHQFPIIELEPGSQKFRVLNINNSGHTMIIARDELSDGSCLPETEIPQNTNFNYSLYTYGRNVRNISLFYNCSDEARGPNSFVYCTEDIPRSGFYEGDGPWIDGLGNLTRTCNSVVKVPVQTSAADDLRDGNLILVLNQGFPVTYLADNRQCSFCENSGGKCGSNQANPEQFVCLCRDKPSDGICKSEDGVDYVLRAFTGILGAIIGIIVTCIIICIWRKNRMLSIMSSLFRWKTTKNNQDIEDFIRNYGPLTMKRYSLSDVKKMTSSFKYKLGQGGYGGVYKGKLSDGRLVAVKLLNTSKGNGQEFINEVASISRTSHVNVVMLLGFCLEGKKRALIYDFMSNGSLEKFIYNKDNSEDIRHLGWEKLYQIAIGIARGLEYLHRGCNTRILHFDIKPHNILLDEDFCPKISDFGLAKLCARNESVLSMLEARGTIGYIAPEVFSRNFGKVSHKSDVYSYGMMVLEMVGGRKNINVEVVNTSEIYFPHWIYRNLEQGEDFKWHGDITNEENEIVKKMIIVGLWCIQTNPPDRPSMNKVIKMLQGNTEDLQIPPKPFLSSPPRPPIDSSTESMS